MSPCVFNPEKAISTTTANASNATASNINILVLTFKAENMPTPQ
jgi:hypothetical protein